MLQGPESKLFRPFTVIAPESQFYSFNGSSHFGSRARIFKHPPRARARAPCAHLCPDLIRSRKSPFLVGAAEGRAVADCKSCPDLERRPPCTSSSCSWQPDPFLRATKDAGSPNAEAAARQFGSSSADLERGEHLCRGPIRSVGGAGPVAPPPHHLAEISEPGVASPGDRAITITA